MATFKAYPNGLTMGVGNAAPVGGKRAAVTGWSAASVRRHKRWLYGVETPGLSGPGSGVTLTLRDTPANHEDWRDLVTRLLQRLRDSGMVRWHWVVEWQRRGTPHLHMAVYGPESLSAASVGELVVQHWLALTADAYGAGRAAQVHVEITGPTGWLKYLSKHASRGVAHYQRQGMPRGWTKSGRLWGYGGDWPITAPIEGVLTMEQFWQVRRMVRRYAIAQARAAALGYAANPVTSSKAPAAWDSVAHLRRLLRNPDRSTSSVRGVSDWCPVPVAVDLMVWAGWSGELSPQPATV
jgi:hypothetical protein